MKKYCFVFLVFLALIIAPAAAQAITIDGDFSDWAGVSQLTPADSSGDAGAGGLVDWMNSWVTDDETYIYVSYQTNDNVDFVSYQTRYNILLDTDNSNTTGYLVNDIGADYLLQGAKVWDYPDAGASSNWSWTELGEDSYGIDANRVEIRFEKAKIAYPETITSVDIVFFGDNWVGEGSVHDYAPDSGHYTYEVTTPVPEPSAILLLAGTFFGLVSIARKRK